MDHSYTSTDGDLMLKVNLGCGEQYADGWLNIDHAGMPHRKDLTLDVRNPLPWDRDTGGIDYAYVGHLLEHLYIDEVIVLLERLRRAMAPDGDLMIVGPDCLIAAGMAVSQTLEVPLEQIRHGADRWEGDVHRWECTRQGIQRLLLLTGWKNVKVLGINDVNSMWPVAFRGPQWQCAVSATPGSEPFHDYR